MEGLGLHILRCPDGLVKGIVSCFPSDTGCNILKVYMLNMHFINIIV